MKVDWIIVGAGFTGAVLAERLASQAGQKVLIVDRRDHIGGNAYDRYDEHGVLIHRYGAHIFHTNSRKIWEYLSQFTSWRPYQHTVKAFIEGKLVPVPFNLNSLSALFPASMADRLERKLIERYGFGVKTPILKMLDEQDPELKELARYIYREVFESYTRKQWDLEPAQLDASVTGRVPVFISRDDRYFQDVYQGIPSRGYTELFHGLLAHPNIRIMLKAQASDILPEVHAKNVIFTGPIDEYFQYRHGQLPYRSLHFDFRYEQTSDFQQMSVVNFPNDHLYTRILEFKHFTGQTVPGTTIAYEYPQPHILGINEPYYPVPCEANKLILAKYASEARDLNGRVYFAGRLADYKYYNMDQAVGRALKLYDDITQAREVAVCDTPALAG
jgi:UDP-galactopyranose mutase